MYFAILTVGKGKLSPVGHRGAEAKVRFRIGEEVGTNAGDSRRRSRGESERWSDFILVGINARQIFYLPFL
mgnify:CR=1 FL=1